MPKRSFQHEAAVRDVVVSVDGKRMVSVDETGAVTLWDLSRTDEPRVLGTHAVDADALAISPDGKSAVSGSQTGQIWFWDLERAAVRKKLQPMSTGVESLAWSPDGNYVAAGARYSEVWVCDAEGRELLRIKNDHRHESLLFTRDSKQLLVPTRQDMQIWDVALGKRVKRFSTAPLTNVRALCWAGAQRQWLVAGERFSESLVISHRATGKRLGMVETGAEYAQHLAASSDGRWLTATYADGRVQIIRLTKLDAGGVQGKVHLQFTAHQVEEARCTARWLADSNQFITAGADGQVQLWDLDEVRPTRILQPPADVSVAFPLNDRELVYIYHGDEPHGERLVRSSYRGQIRSPPGRKLQFVPGTTSGASRRSLIPVERGGKVAVLSLEAGLPICTIPSPIGGGKFVALSQDGAALVVSSENRIAVWKTCDRWANHELVRTWNEEPLTIPIFADDGRTLIARVDGEGLVEWDLKTGGVLRSHDVTIAGKYCYIDPPGELLATATAGGIRVWSRRTGKRLLDVKNLSDVRVLQFAPDGRVLVSGHQDGKILAWHLSTGEALGVLYEPTQALGKPESLYFPGDGEFMLIGYRKDGNLRLVVLGAPP
jgi:WD40 repeat protein